MFRDTGFCHILQKSFDGIEHPQTMLGVFTGEQEEPSGFFMPSPNPRDKDREKTRRCEQTR